MLSVIDHFRFRLSKCGYDVLGWPRACLDNICTGRTRGAFISLCTPCVRARAIRVHWNLNGIKHCANTVTLVLHVTLLSGARYWQETGITLSPESLTGRDKQMFSVPKDLQHHPTRLYGHLICTRVARVPLLPGWWALSSCGVRRFWNILLSLMFSLTDWLTDRCSRTSNMNLLRQWLHYTPNVRLTCPVQWKR